MNPVDAFTRRENDVVIHIKSGKSNHEISAELCISIKAVEAHITNIYQKLGVKNRVQAVLALLEKED